MKALALAPCMALSLLGVAGLQTPALVRRVSRKTSASPWNSGRWRRPLPTAGEGKVAKWVGTTAIMRVESAPDPERYGAALTTTALVVSGATAFGAGVNQFMGADKALQYFAGYVVELSLSVDNLFVFLLLFNYFKVTSKCCYGAIDRYYTGVCRIGIGPTVDSTRRSLCRTSIAETSFLCGVGPVIYVQMQVPLDYQKRVLSWGILGAVVMRAVFIALGETAMNLFHPVLLGFAGVLIFSSYKLWSEEDDDNGGDLSENAIVALASKFLDATESYDGDNFFTMVRATCAAVANAVVIMYGKNCLDCDCCA